MARKIAGKAPKRCRSKFAGTPTGYRHHQLKRQTNKRHLICDACRDAIRIHHADYRKRRILAGAKVDFHTHSMIGGNLMVDAAGTRRRLMALSALGYGWNEIGRRLGQNGTNVGFTALKRQWVYKTTHEKVKALYDELSMVPAEKTREVKVVLTRSARKGFLPPLAWDDETIDDPYTLPEGLEHRQAHLWFWGAASEVEKIEWVLEHGLAVTRSR